MRGFILFSIYFLFALAAQAQFPGVFPSPNGMSVARSANVQVGHYTGTTNIDIPFGEVPGKGLNIPLSLNYTTDGIRVQDVAGPAGLGWSLVAGGAITRVVRGIPDGIVDEMCPSHNDPSELRFFDNMNGDCDGEYDIFYFNFLGRTGKIINQGDQGCFTMPYQDIHITSPVGTTATHWVITDEAGYQYHFGESAAAREETTYYLSTDGTNYSQKHTFVSTWYLNKIISPTGIQVVTFTYETGEDVEYKYTSYLRVDLFSTARITKIKIIEPKYISAVQTQIAKAIFTYSADRLDLTNGMRLNAVLFQDQNGINRKRFTLIQDYFTRTIGSVTDNLHLRLLKVKEGLFNTIDAYSFLYYEDPTENPARENFNTDHFGYYNGPKNQCNPTQWVYTTCNWCKQPVGSRRKVYSLREVNYSSGNRTVIEYDDSASRGMRVKSISTYDCESLVGKSAFTYAGESPELSPDYSYTTHDNKTVCSTTSFTEVMDLNGVGGFSIVTETALDGSRIVRKFYNVSEYADDVPFVRKYKHDIPEEPEDKGSQNPNGPPFIQGTSRSWMRGLPMAVRVYDSENHRLTQDTLIYEEGSDFKSVNNVVVHVYKQTSDNVYTYMVGEYSFVSRPVYLKETNHYVYGQDGYFASTPVISKTKYNYHSTHKTFPNSIITQTGTGPEEKITIKYPTDITIGSGNAPSSASPGASGIWALIANHIVTPIEKIMWFKPVGSSSFNVMGAVLMTYRKNPVTQMPLPYEEYSLTLNEPIASLSPYASLQDNGTTLVTDARYRKDKTYTHNDATSLLTSTTGRDGITTAFEYENGALVSALTFNPGASEMKTQYGNSSILGPQMVTDPNGRNTKAFYEQDMGRIQLIKDHDNNILKRFRYHTTGESLSLPGGPLTQSGCPMVGTSTSFTATIFVDYGDTKYEWDFGDGHTQTTTNGTISHTYTTGGFYTVKVKRSNAEYLGTQESNISVIISGEITSASVCATGIVQYDICHVDPNVVVSCSIEEALEDAPEVLTVGGGIGTFPTFRVLPNNLAAHYQWEYKKYGDANWTSFGLDISTVTGPPGYGDGVPGGWEVRCVLTDPCGSTFISDSYSVNCYASAQCN